MTYDEIQKIEAQTWLIPEEDKRREKAQREFIRYPLLKRQMGLDYLDTTSMVIWDVGAGPLGGVSSLLRAKSITRYDPLADEYAKFFPCHSYSKEPAERLDYSIPDLVIITNALDHFENPTLTLKMMNACMKYGSYFASLHAENNAITHPHPAHQHNVNPEMMRGIMSNFEIVWSLDYMHDGLTYGWRKQPAFSFLMRKIS